MKRFIIVFLCVFVSNCIMAQNHGGEVSRTDKVGKMDRQKKTIVQRKNDSSDYLNGINRTINGIVLGKSTMQDVVNCLKQKKIRYENEVIAGSPSISYFKATPFGGITWDYFSCEFFNNIVFWIRFTKAVRPSVPKDLIELEYSMLTDKLSRKYHNHSIKTGKRRGMDNFKIEDGRTIIELEKGYEGSTFLMSISYIDFNLSIDKINNNHDEL